MNCSKHFRLISGLIAVPLIALGNAKSPGEPRVVSEVNLQRYAGQWYEIARFPNWFQKDCTGNVTANYTLRVDGRITVLNKCQIQGGNYKQAEGEARKAKESGPNAKLKVRFAPKALSFLPFVWGDYWIIELAPDYSYAAVGDPSHKYLWILSRSPNMEVGTYQRLLKRVSEEGFDSNRLVRTNQTGQ